jgi:hypothetical protein
MAINLLARELDQRTEDDAADYLLGVLTDYLYNATATSNGNWCS